MEIALMGASMLERSWEEMLDSAKRNDISFIEACAGGHIPKVHYDPIRLASEPAALDAFRQSLEDRGQNICSFSCHGNPLHPNPAIAHSAHQDFIATCRIASQLGVRNICMLAGTPGGGPDDKAPNWIMNSAWPMFRNAYRWQWDERIIPYWRDAAKIADNYGVKMCIEPHTGDVVYNTQTFLRLREAVGPTMGMNFDPSHLWWQGIDPIVFVETIGAAIYSVHVKDVFFDKRLVERDGMASSADYDDWNSRPWKYCTIGYGHSELFWRDLIIALRRVGYEGPLTIECEEPYLTIDESLSKATQLLKNVMPITPPPAANWMAGYDLDDYDGRLSGATKK